MPMDKNFTQEIMVKKNVISQNVPKMSTIEFIKQFARIYSVKGSVKSELNGFIAN